MDFYKQRRFICEITGHSGMNFFEALRSEVCGGWHDAVLGCRILSVWQMEESREVNNSFPEALKEPILRRIQFSTVSRLDNLGMSSKDGCVLNRVELTLYSLQWTKFMM